MKIKLQTNNQMMQSMNDRGGMDVNLNTLFKLIEYSHIHFVTAITVDGNNKK